MRLSGVVVWLALVALLAGCSTREPLYSQESYVFGTRVEVVVYGVKKPQAEQAIAAVLADFDRLHHRLHAWEPGELDQLNQAFAEGRRVPVAPDLAAILTDATRLSDRSGGVFNPAIGNLIRLWGFQSDTFASRLPSQQAIDALLVRHPVMDDIVIRNGQAYSINPAVRVDLGGYAKGYALDVAAVTLRRYGIRDALVNIGGNIMVLGSHGGRPWRVGIQDPRRPEAMAEVDLHDGAAIGTSGDYQRYFEFDGRRYCHIIDPATGWPAQGVRSVTVLIPPGPHAGVLSDVDSKPLFIAGPQGWRAAAVRMGVVAAMLVDAQGKVHLTPAMQLRVKWNPRG